MSKTMADVLAGHQQTISVRAAATVWSNCMCGAYVSGVDDIAAHQAAALSAAGFGPVKDAKVGALADAADKAIEDLPVSSGRPRIRAWLRGRAAAERGQG